MSEQEYFIGVDGGGSKTTAIVTDGEMNIVGRGRAGPSNFLRVGMDEAARELQKAVIEATAEADIPLASVAFTYCGIAGADHPRNRKRFVERLGDLFPAGNFTIDNDARIALHAALGGKPGVVIIAGTGSVAFGRNAAGEEARAGGWGPTLGDEGSGYSIARKGLSMIVRAFDGRGPATAMTEILCEHYGMCEPDDLPLFVYAPSTNADDIALYYRMVIEAARRGDPAACSIFENEGRELGECVVAVARRLGMCLSRFPVAHVGGAFHAGELLLAPLDARLREVCPYALLQPPLATPVEGAAQLAMRSATTARPGRYRGVQ